MILIFGIAIKDFEWVVEKFYFNKYVIKPDVNKTSLWNKGIINRMYIVNSILTNINTYKFQL